MTVSPGRGSGEPKAARSALMLPTTATPVRSSMSPESPFFCVLLAHRAVSPPPSSLAEDRTPLLAPPPCAGARFPTLAALFCVLQAHRAVSPPPSSLAEDRTPLLASPPCAGARFPTLAARAIQLCPVERIRLCSKP